MRVRRRVIAVVLTLVAVLVAVAVHGGRQPSAGGIAPEFTLAAHDGKSASLKDFRRKWVVLYFYPANFTRMGTLQAERFQQDLAKYAQANAVILGVSAETAQSNRDFAKQTKLAFPLLSDPGARVSDQYGSTQNFHMRTLAARNTFIIDPEGRVAQVFLDVDPERHSPEVLRALATLQRQ